VFGFAIDFSKKLGKHECGTGNQRCAWTGFWIWTPAASNRNRSMVFFAVAWVASVFVEKTLLVVYLTYFNQSQESVSLCLVGTGSGADLNSKFAKQERIWCQAKLLTCKISDFTQCAHAQSNILHIKYADKTDD